jgi:hypothetical protein
MLLSYSASKFAVRGMTQSAGACLTSFLNEHSFGVACAEDSIFSVGTREARHYRKCVRPGRSGDTASSVIPPFIHASEATILHVIGQSTNLMSTWSRSPDHVRDATGLVATNSSSSSATTSDTTDRLYPSCTARRHGCGRSYRGNPRNCPFGIISGFQRRKLHYG